MMTNRPRCRLARTKGRRSVRAAVLTVALWAILAGSPPPARAHGVYLTRSDGPAVTLHAGYSSGDPVAYAEVKVLAPNDKDAEYLNGRTDRNGDFAFVPDGAGQWRVIVNAGMGHRAQLALNVGSNAAMSHTPSRPAVDPLRILLGCSLFANLGFLVSRRKAAAKPKHAS